MAENAHKPEKAVPCCSAVEHPKLISLSEERRNLISVANKVFGEGKWSHTVVKQTSIFDSADFDSDDIYTNVIFDEVIYAMRRSRWTYDRNKYCARCISFIKIQLENGNFHEKIGYYSAEETTKGLSIHSARIGSAVNALKRILLSFGDKVERELQQLQRQISSEQVNTFAAAEPMDLAINFYDLILVANKVFGEGKWNHTVVRQILDVNNYFDDEYFDDVINRGINAQNKCYASCVSYVKIQLENGTFHEDIGYFKADKFTVGLSMRTVRIGSAINALFRVLLSFGDKVERELKQLRRHIGSERVNTFTAAESMDVAMNFHDLILMANKVFGEGRWNYSVISQTLDLIDTDDVNYAAIDARDKYRTGCVSFVEVQLENGNFHRDVGYFNAEEFTRGLSIYNARIGSAVNALKRVLLSFGDKVERELQQLQRQISSDEEPMDLAVDFPDLISAANKVFGEGKWNHTVVRQTLDFNGVDSDDKDFYDVNNCEIDARIKYCAGCVSYVKIQLENGNFHEDIGYINEDEITEGLSIQNARIGSAVYALKRVLLSFGDKVKRELQQLRGKISSERVNMFATAESTDLATNFPDLISAANKVFGESKWNYTVVSQILDFNVLNHAVINARGKKYRAGCVSSVKVQLENGNFHEDVGYFIAEEPTQNLLISSARIGSAVNALRRVFLSFGDKVERELQQLQRQISSDQEPMDLAADFPDLISAANKVFGKSKWNHTVVSQTLDFDYENYATLNAPRVYYTGCVSFVKVQLENGNFHEDVGYFNAEESTRNLSIYNARIGSAVNALRRVLLSFGEKIEKELQRQVIPKQVSDMKRNAIQSLEPMDLIAELPDLISAANKVFGEGNWRHTVVKQTLAKKYAVEGDEYHADCVSYVKVQLKNENFHVDVGYCITKEPTQGLAILNAKIGSAVNALKRVLMSFGEQFERELQQLQRQISPEQTDDVQRDVA